MEQIFLPKLKIGLEYGGKAKVESGACRHIHQHREWIYPGNKPTKLR